MSTSNLKKCVSLFLVVFALSMINATTTTIYEQSIFSLPDTSIPTEADVRDCLVCFKETSFALDAIKEDPKTLLDVTELVKAAQICKNEIQFSVNRVCDYSYDKIQSLAAKLRNNKTFFNQLDNIRITCSKIPQRVLDFVTLLIQEHRLTQDQIDLKDSQETNTKPQLYHNLQLGEETQHEYRTYAETAKDIGSLLVSPIVAPLMKLEEIIGKTSLEAIIALPFAAITLQILLENYGLVLLGNMYR